MAYPHEAVASGSTALRLRRRRAFGIGSDNSPAFFYQFVESMLFIGPSSRRFFGTGKKIRQKMPYPSLMLQPRVPAHQRIGKYGTGQILSINCSIVAHCIPYPVWPFPRALCFIRFDTRVKCNRHTSRGHRDWGRIFGFQKRMISKQLQANLKKAPGAIRLRCS